MQYGDFSLGKTLYVTFTTSAQGVPTTLSGSPVVSVYPNGSTTELTAGVTLTVDLDSLTGLNLVTIVATSGNGFATATNYDVVVTAGTVGGISVVGYVVAAFSIEARSALRPTTPDRTALVAADGSVSPNWGDVKSPTTVVALTNTTVGTASAVTTVNGLAANIITAASMAADASAEIADAVWDEVSSGHTTAGTFGQWMFGVRSGTAQGGAASSITLDAGASATTSIYFGQEIQITAGTGAGQSALITSYDGATKIAGVRPSWTTQPDNTSVFVIVRHAPVSVELWRNSAVVAPGTAGVPSVDTIRVANTLQTAGDLAAMLTVIDDFLDTEIAAILAAVDTEVTSIKNKTDSLTFTVAGQVDSNLESINATNVIGNGGATPWGP